LLTPVSTISAYIRGTKRTSEHMKIILRSIAIFLSIGVAAVVVIMLIARHRPLNVKKNRSDKIYEAEMTKMSFPVLISMSDIEKIANTKIKHVLIDKRIPMKNGNDTLILKVTRLGNLDFELDNSYFNSSVPLKLEIQFIKKIIGKKNVQFFKNEPLTLLISAKFRSAINLREDMKLKIHTTLSEIVWNEEPNVKVLGIEFNVKEKINEMLLEKAPDITSKIDGLVADKINLKRPALKVWNKIQNGIKINKKQKDLYVKIQPKTLSIHVDKTMNDSLKLDLIVMSKIFVRFAEDTADIERMAFPKKINIMSRHEVDEFSKLHLHCLFPLKQLNKIIKKQLEGKEFDVKGLTVKIRRIEVFNGANNIYVKIKHSGSIEGQIILRGFPELSEDHRTLSIKNVSFENKLKDEMFNSMTDVLHDQILSIMKDYTSFDIGDLMESIPDQARTALKKSKLAKKADISLDGLEVDNLEVRLTRRNIQLIVSGHSSFGISLKKDSFKALKKKKAS